MVGKFIGRACGGGRTYMGIMQAARVLRRKCIIIIVGVAGAGELARCSQESDTCFGGAGRAGCVSG